jgi:hypothetical protein
MVYALIAAITMVVTDILGVIMVQAEAHNRGWLAGWMDTAQWLVGITTTTITVTVLQGHSLTMKALVIVLVSAANLFGTKLGQVIGAHFVTDTNARTISQRLDRLESQTPFIHSPEPYETEHPMATLPTIPASLKARVKKIAADVAIIGASVGAALAALVNLAPSVHLPAADVAFLVSAASVVAAAVKEAKRVHDSNVAAKKAS